MDVIHTALWVEEIDRTLAFYRDALGLEPTDEFVGGDGSTNVFLAGDDGTELQFKYYADRPNDPIEPSGFAHVALGVDDTDATVERLVEATGCEVRRGPLDSAGADARVAFVEDPDGYVVELVGPLPERGGYDSAYGAMASRRSSGSAVARSPSTGTQARCS
ncbi:MAG: VOC family protein [Halobacteriales archaeon]|nr:VOC family protein [Halobacteriales archaeon]